MPGDCSSMVHVLEKYAKSSFDILGSLPENIAARILRDFDIPDLLELGLVNLMHLIWLERAAC